MKRFSIVIVYLIIFILPILILMAGCGERPTDVRLWRLHERATLDSLPNEILTSLDSIDPSVLSRADRKLYELTHLKAEDKAYIVHESDSVILSLVEYYRKNPYRDLYPEALYYAGRVYCDMGDYPTSLRYFQDALEALPENTPNTNLRGVIQSQTGGLLSSLRLYDEAIPYLRSSIEEARLRNDTSSTISDLRSLGHIYLQDYQFKKSEECLLSALSLCDSRRPELKAIVQMHLADLKNMMGKTDSARLLIHGLPEKVHPLVRNNALNTAAEIYLDAGLPDSAFYYCSQLLASDNDLNKHMAYHYLLSPELVHYNSADTIAAYAVRYREILEDRFDENQNQLSLYQESLYNYELHERERAKAESRNRKLVFILVGVLTLTLLLTVIILFLKNRNKNNIIRLQLAIDTIHSLAYEIERKKSIENHFQDMADQEATPNLQEDDRPEPYEPKSLTSVLVPSKKLEEDLRGRLIDELKALYSRTKGVIPISSIILQSTVYTELQKMVEGNRVIDDSFNWGELEKVITEAAPDFRKRLTVLTQGKLTSIDLHTAMLIKCGIAPTQMAILFGRSKGAIVSRRESLSLKLFDQKLGTKITDSIIRLL